MLCLVVNTSLFLLNATLQNHIKDFNWDSDLTEKLSESVYVDDLCQEKGMMGCINLLPKIKEVFSCRQILFAKVGIHFKVIVRSDSG